MNKNFKKISTLIALSLWGSNLIAGSVTVPNTFSANTPAVAANVNENFTTLADGVNNNDANIGINASNITALQGISIPSSYRVEDKNGNDIGALITFGGTWLSTLTDKGYIYHLVYLANGKQYVSDIIFSDANCLSTPYVPYFGNGAVFVNAGSMWYVDKLATAIELTANSRFNPTTGVCDPVASQLYTDAFPALVNDPVITGATKLEGQQPFTIQIK